MILNNANIAAIISIDEALALVAGKTSKPSGVDPSRWFRDDPSGTVYAFGKLPLTAFSANEEVDRYDGTVDIARATLYASMASEAPPVLAVLSRDGTCLRIMDGGHRISAARIRGDETISTIVRFRPGKLESLMVEPGDIVRQGWSIAVISPVQLKKASLRF